MRMESIKTLARRAVRRLGSVEALAAALDCTTATVNNYLRGHAPSHWRWHYKQLKERLEALGGED